MVKQDKFDEEKLLGYAVTDDDDYGFSVQSAICVWNGKKYILLTRHVQGTPDKSIGIPIRYVNAISDLLLHSYRKVKEDCKNENYKSPSTIKFLD